MGAPQGTLAGMTPDELALRVLVQLPAPDRFEKQPQLLWWVSVNAHALDLPFHPCLRDQCSPGHRDSSCRRLVSMSRSLEELLGAVDLDWFFTYAAVRDTEKAWERWRNWL